MDIEIENDVSSYVLNDVIIKQFENCKMVAMSLDSDEAPDFNAVSYSTPTLSPAEVSALDAQSSRLVPHHQAKMLEVNAKKHWDLFYKRNQTKFFKDRNWTTREFVELVGRSKCGVRILLEVGCGVGNLIFPLIKEGMSDLFFYACDFSPRAIELVKSNNLYNEKHVKAFVADITSESACSEIEIGSVDLVSMVFVLSAILPSKWEFCTRLIWRLMKPGGLLLFRDYGRYDMAQLRFKAGNKIAENLYMRQDGTRSYFFELEELKELFLKTGFEVVSISYIQRRTINIKEGVNVPRTFVQAKFRKLEDRR